MPVGILLFIRGLGRHIGRLEYCQPEGAAHEKKVYNSDIYDSPSM